MAQLWQSTRGSKTYMTLYLTADLDKQEFELSDMQIHLLNRKLKTVMFGVMEGKNKRGRPHKQRMGGRRRGLSQGHAAEIVPFGAGYRRMETENQADTGGL